MPSSPDNLRMLLVRFASKDLSTASESTVLGHLNFAWSSRFLQTERNFLNYLAILINFAFIFRVQAFLSASFAVWPQFELAEHQVQIRLRYTFYLCCFQITPGVKKCEMH